MLHLGGILRVSPPDRTDRQQDVLCAVCHYPEYRCYCTAHELLHFPDAGFHESFPEKRAEKFAGTVGSCPENQHHHHIGIGSSHCGLRAGADVREYPVFHDPAVPAAGNAGFLAGSGDYVPVLSGDSEVHHQSLL